MRSESNPGAGLPAALLVFLQPVLPRGVERAAVVGVAAVLVPSGVGRLVEGDVVVEAAGPVWMIVWVKIMENYGCTKSYTGWGWWSETRLS